MNRSTLMTAVLVVSSTFASAALAAPRRPAAPPVTHAASAPPSASYGDARLDAREARELEDRYAHARRMGNRTALHRVEQDVQRYLAVELRETRLERLDARRDGRREVRHESRELSRLREIDRDFRTLGGRFDPGSLGRKQGLVSELVRLARTERGPVFVSRR